MLSAGPIVDTVFDAIFGGRIDFSWILILCIVGLRKYREVVRDTIWSRMHESASKLVRSGRSSKFASVFMFPRSLMLFVAIPGRPDANRGFSIFARKLILVELGLKLKDLGWEFEDLGLTFEDL